MLQKLNERIQGLVAWVIIVMVTITFVFFGIDYYLQSRHESTPKVVVNGEVISKQDFDVNYRRTQRAHESLSSTEEGVKALKQQVLDDMIQNKVTVQSAKKLGFEVSDSEANAAILQIPQFQKDGHFSENRYSQALNGAFFTPQTFQNEVRQGMLINQLRFALVGSVFVLSNELKHFVALSMQTRDYRYATLHPLVSAMTLQVSEKDVVAYYKLHPEEFRSEEQVSVDYLHVSLQNIKANLKLSEDDLKKYYDENRDNYMAPASWNLKYIRFVLPVGYTAQQEAMIKQTANSFYEKAVNQPDQFQAGSKTLIEKHLAEQGVLTNVHVGENFTYLDDVLPKLTIPGQLTQPLKTEHGYDVYQLTAYKNPQIRDFVEVKPFIKEQLTTELAQKKYSDQIEQLSDLSFQNSDSLEPIARDMHLKVEHTPLFSRQDSKQNPGLVQAAFSQDVLIDGNNSEPTQLNEDEGMVVVRVRKHVPAAQKPLSEVKNTIIAILTKNKSEELAKNQADTWASEPESEATKQLEAGLSWKQISASNRDAEPAIINETAFDLPKKGSRGSCRLNNGDYALVELTKIKNGNIDELDKEQITSMSQQLEANYGLMDFDWFLNQLVTQASIQ